VPTSTVLKLSYYLLFKGNGADKMDLIELLQSNTKKVDGCRKSRVE
jgi:hypothetical protein